MKWLTKAYIRKQARKSIQAALECSLEHWRQLAEATDQVRIEAMASGKVGVRRDFCACCSRARPPCVSSCAACPLYTYNDCCNGLWCDAFVASPKDFRPAARKVRNFIATVLRKHLKKSKK